MAHEVHATAAGGQQATSHTVARLINRARERGGLTAEDIGSIVGVGQRQVQNWAAGRGRPADKERLRRLTDLQYVLDLLTDIYDAEGSVIWLNSRNKILEGQRPMDLLAAGRADEVIEVLQQLADGNM